MVEISLRRNREVPWAVRSHGRSRGDTVSIPENFKAQEE
jgi:hypothetical protein